jgi:hypothetical protein
VPSGSFHRSPCALENRKSERHVWSRSVTFQMLKARPGGEETKEGGKPAARCSTCDQQIISSAERGRERLGQSAATMSGCAVLSR